MKKIALSAFVILMVAVTYFVCSSSSENKEYSKNDLYNYYFLTDKDIKNAPRVSEQYYFSYVPADGGQREMSSIFFSGGETPLLTHYLSSLGFSLYRTQDSGREQIWLSPTDRETVFSVWHDRQQNLIRLTKTTL